MASIPTLMAQVVADPKAVVEQEQQQMKHHNTADNTALFRKRRPQRLIPDAVLEEVERLARAGGAAAPNGEEVELPFMVPFDDETEEIGGGVTPHSSPNRSKQSKQKHSSTTKPRSIGDQKNHLLNRSTRSWSSEGVPDVAATIGRRLSCQNPPSPAAQRALTPGVTTLTGAGAAGSGSRGTATTPGQKSKLSGVAGGGKFTTGIHYLNSAEALLGKCPRRDLKAMVCTANESAVKADRELHALELRRKKKNAPLPPLNTTTAATPVTGSTSPSSPSSRPQSKQEKQHKNGQPQLFTVVDGSAATSQEVSARGGGVDHLAGLGDSTQSMSTFLPESRSPKASDAGPTVSPIVIAMRSQPPLLHDESNATGASAQELDASIQSSGAKASRSRIFFSDTDADTDGTSLRLSKEKHQPSNSSISGSMKKVGSGSLLSRSASQGGSFFKLERRAAASKRTMDPAADGSSKLSVSVDDLVLIVRVASLDAAKRSEHVVTGLTTHNYGLGWIYDLKHRPSDHIPQPGEEDQPHLAGGEEDEEREHRARGCTPITFVNSPLLAHSSPNARNAGRSAVSTLPHGSSTNAFPSPSKGTDLDAMSSTFHAPPDKPKVPWMTLDNMPVDYLECGGNPEDPVALLNSPRSALTFLRNGMHPMALQRKPFSTLRAQLSIQGLSMTDIKQRQEFLETFRQNELESLQLEYRELCKLLPRSELNIFFELIDPMGGMIGLPKLLWNADLGHYQVQVSADDALASAMEDMRAKMAKDKVVLASMLKVEIDARERLVHLHELEQQKNIKASLRTHERAKALAQEKQQEAQIRKMALDMKAERLAEVKKVSDANRLRDIAAREARAKIAEEAQQAAAAEQREKKRAQLEEKRSLRAERVFKSTVKAEKIMRKREEALVEKDQYRQRQLERKRESQEEKRIQRQAEVAILNARRLEIVERSEEMLREREVKAAQVQERVEKRLIAFANEKAVATELRNISDLAKEIQREEVALEAKNKEEQKIVAQLVRREAQQERFQAYKCVQVRDREIKVEQTKQVNELKVNYVQRQARQRMFKELAIADKQLRDVKQAEALENTRTVMVEKARAERAQLMLYRRTKLKTTADDIEKKERSSFFATFNHGQSPSPAPKRKGGPGQSGSPPTGTMVGMGESSPFAVLSVSGGPFSDPRSRSGSRLSISSAQNQPTTHADREPKPVIG